MAHKNIPHESRNNRLRRMTKNKARSIIQQGGIFHGYICGSSVNSAHIAQSWNLGEEVCMDNLDEFDTYVNDLENVLLHYAPGLGPHVHFYQITGQSNTTQRSSRHGKTAHHTIKEASS